MAWPSCRLCWVSGRLVFRTTGGLDPRIMQYEITGHIYRAMTRWSPQDKFRAAAEDSDGNGTCWAVADAGSVRGENQVCGGMSRACLSWRLRTIRSPGSRRAPRPRAQRRCWRSGVLGGQVVGLAVHSRNSAWHPRSVLLKNGSRPCGCRCRQI